MYTNQQRHLLNYVANIDRSLIEIIKAYLPNFQDWLYSFSDVE